MNRDGAVIIQQRADGATGATVQVSLGQGLRVRQFPAPTAGLHEAAKTNPGFINIPGFNILPGGLPIALGGSVVAGIGVSGAPSGEIDAACATAGIQSHFLTPPKPEGRPALRQPGGRPATPGQAATGSAS